mgnify:CR=1 FL=1
MLSTCDVQRVQRQLAAAADVSRSWNESNRVDAHKTTSTGAPFRGRGNGQLFLVVRSLLMKNNSDIGPAVLLIKETNGGVWGPPGGKTDKEDLSVLHAAMREFGEELGTDWRNLANEAGVFQIVRLQSTPGSSEAWMMLVDLDASAAENTLFREDRSAWPLRKRMKTPLSKETAGYAFVPLEALLNADTKSGAFRLGKYTETLRYAWRTRDEARKIATALNQLGH